jgi:mutator protein MutT
MEFISLAPLKDFNPTVEVAGCYCEFEDKILFLKRASHKHQGDMWGIPGGKLDEGETPRMAVIREVFEEVGIPINEDNLQDHPWRISTIRL